jgi:hypothetical protein
MTGGFDVTALTKGIDRLRVEGRARRCLAVVLPLKEGMSEVVREYVAEGPPFDPALAGLDRHQVLVTDREAIFFFESEGGLETLERILAEPDFWDVVAAWEHATDGPPRVADEIYRWPERDAG